MWHQVLETQALWSQWQVTTYSSLPDSLAKLVNSRFSDRSCFKTKMDSSEWGCLLDDNLWHSHTCAHMWTSSSTLMSTQTHNTHKTLHKCTRTHSYENIHSVMPLCVGISLFYFIALNRTLCVYSKFIQPVLCWWIFGLFLLWQTVMQGVTLNRQQENLSLNFSNNV